MFQEVFEGYFVRGFATEEEFCEKIVFGEAFGNVFLQPTIKFGLARGCEVIDFAVGATFLDDDFGLDEFRVAEGFQGYSINLFCHTIFSLVWDDLVFPVL